MDILLETPRLFLRPFTENDFRRLHALHTDKNVMRYIGNGIRDRTTIESDLKKIIKHQEKHGFSLFAVFEKASNKFVGRAGLIYLGYDEDKEIEVNYVLHKQFWGKGYATELLNGLLNYGFYKCKFQKIVAVVNYNNESSRHVLEKNGMKYIKQYLYKYWGTEAMYYEKSVGTKQNNTSD